MINSWSLLYDELYGDDEMTAKTYPIENNELNDENIVINTGIGSTGIYNVPDNVPDPDGGINTPEGYKFADTLITGADHGVVNVPDIEHSDAWYDYTRNDPDRENPFTDPKDRERADRVVGKTDDDTITITGGDFVNFDLGVGNTSYADTVHLDLGSYSDPFISAEDVITFGGDDAFVATPPGIESNNPRKYKEDESIKALQDYISTTYGGHYTSKENNVQTLDLIESVGDAESFCRSNAIKYLSRYDKKGQAKRDILKALHYTLLLYHFSGQLNETPTRGYETF